MKMIFQVEH